MTRAWCRQPTGRTCRADRHLGSNLGGSGRTSTWSLRSRRASECATVVHGGELRSRPRPSVLGVWFASDFAIEVSLFFYLILGGCSGHGSGGRDDGERQAASAAAADARREVGAVSGGDLAGDLPGRRGSEVRRRRVGDHPVVRVGPRMQRWPHLPLRSRASGVSRGCRAGAVACRGNRPRAAPSRPELARVCASPRPPA